MLTHSHVAFELKSSYLVQVTHTTMGALTVLVACGRLLELRLASAVGRAAGIASSIAMLLIALVLVFYREANVEIPAAVAVTAATPAIAPDPRGAALIRMRPATAAACSPVPARWPRRMPGRSR